MAKRFRTIHAFFESTVIHVLAMWIGLFAGLIVGQKGAGGGIIIEYALALCVPFFVSGFIVCRQNNLAPLAFAPIGAIAAMAFHATVISYYMWNRIAIESQQLPYLAFAVFSFIGVVVADAVRGGGRGLAE